jgi:hypothetical protein
MNQHPETHQSPSNNRYSPIPPTLTRPQRNQENFQTIHNNPETGPKLMKYPIITLNQSQTSIRNLNKILSTNWKNSKASETKKKNFDKETTLYFNKFVQNLPKGRNILQKIPNNGQVKRNSSADSIVSSKIYLSSSKPPFGPQAKFFIGRNGDLDEPTHEKIPLDCEDIGITATSGSCGFYTKKKIRASSVESTTGFNRTDFFQKKDLCNGSSNPAPIIQFYLNKTKPFKECQSILYGIFSRRIGGIFLGN